MQPEQMQLERNWKDIRRLFARSFGSSFHYAIASVNENGEPHVTPIGSLILCEPGRGFYFEEFPRQLRRNLEINQRVCVLAVNSGIWFWLRSLFGGRFVSPPAVRLYGTVGELREASAQEIRLWHRRVGKLRFTKGYRLMWKNMQTVRDIHFTRMEPVRIGEMTRRSWATASAQAPDARC
jgi:hypothetical protein